MNSDPKILILSFSPIARDPRVMRQVRLLASRARLYAMGYGPTPDANLRFASLDGMPPRKRFRLRTVRAEIKLLLGMFDSYYWNRPETKFALQLLDGEEFDLVLVNDVPALPLGLRLAQGAPVLLDAHEYSPSEFEDRLLWRLRTGRLYHYLCRRYLPSTAAMTTVCEGVAREYSRVFNVNASVIENAPVRQELVPAPMEAGKVRMIHHGAAIRSRHLELMIDVLKRTDSRFSLDFMLVGNDQRYLQELRERAAGESRIRFLPPVPMPDICAATNRYDVGLFLLPPVNYNYRFALPNKLFEFIQARLAVAIGPSPEMARVVRQHGVGVVADSFDPVDLANALNRLTSEEVMRCKQASHAAAESLCFEVAADRLTTLVDRLLQPAKREALAA
jgi:glycosyltransferase involved in cell wall biosynthesis